MTWSNVGDKPGRDRLKRVTKPKGNDVKARGGLKQVAGAQRPESPQERAARLRKIARGER